MNQTLHDAFLAGTKPFDLFTVFSTPDLSPAELLEAQRLTLNFIAAYYPTPYLFILDDWHQHDGHITIETNIDPKTLRSFALSEESLLASASGDHLVAKLVYPSDQGFLWRWIIEDERNLTDGDLWCSYDFTACEHDAYEISKYLTAIKGKRFTKEPAKQYFMNRYNG